jgi:hypothetical protein
VPALGSSTSTTPSQNAIRNRNRMTPTPAALLKAALGGHHNRGALKTGFSLQSKCVAYFHKS